MAYVKLQRSVVSEIFMDKPESMIESNKSEVQASILDSSRKIHTPVSQSTFMYFVD